MSKTMKIGRRDFLKLTSLAAGAAALLAAQGKFNFEPQVQFLDALIRGTFDGQIMASLDDGQSWNKLVNFGNQFSVSNLAVTQGQLVAVMELNGRYFRIQTTDGRKWYTV